MALPTRDDEILILHNPRCSRSRQAMALLESSGRKFDVRQYLDDPLSAAELGELAKRLGRPVGKWLRWKDAPELDRNTPEAELVAAMAATPKLMERPIVICGRRAVLGRPPEDVNTLLV